MEKSEFRSLEYSDFCFFLTSVDKKLTLEHYQIQKQSDILPFYYEDPLITKNYEGVFDKDKEILKVIFTGSLNYAPNIEAAMFLIKNAEKIQNVLDTKLQIIIAGRNPNQVLIENVKNGGLISIIPNPSKEEMDTILFESNLFVSPVFNGSGIKTKIVEALAHGLPIILSEHSFIGYEFLSDYIDKVIFKFEDGNLPDFISKLELWKNKYRETSKKIVFDEVRDIYKKYFSFENVEQKLFSILEIYHKKGKK